MKDLDNNKFTKLFRPGLMIAIYVGMSVVIVFTSLFDNLFAHAPQLRYGMGAVFLVYGLFRAYRLWKTL